MSTSTSTSTNKRISAAIGALICAFALALSAGAFAQTAWADETAIYTVPAEASYYNPVTGEVEDSAGDSNTELGESMVEGCAYDNALVEIDENGDVWVTMRLKLADQLGDVGVEVDNEGDGDFSEVEVTEMQTAVENEGEDTETQLIDLRFQVPSTDCYERVSMYVDPMGRDVVFFLILDMDGAEEGNTDEIPFVESVVAGEEIAGAEESSSSGTMVALIVVIVIAVIVIAVLLWYFLSYKPKHEAQTQAAQSATSAAAAAAAAAAPQRTHPALADEEEAGADASAAAADDADADAQGKDA